MYCATLKLRVFAGMVCKDILVKLGICSMILVACMFLCVFVFVSDCF